MDISDTSATAEGGKKILIFCEKVAREDICVRFSDGHGWEGWGDFNPSDVHKQYGISLKTPKYRDGNIKEKTKVFLELYKKSDDSVSEPQDFYFVPSGKTEYNMMTNGHKNMNSVNSGVYKDVKIKQETVDHHSWSQARLNGGYVHHPGMHSSPSSAATAYPAPQPSTAAYNTGYNNIQQSYIPNIPTVTNTQGLHLFYLLIYFS